MDTSELHYVTYDPEETWDEMHKTYLEKGGDVLYPGDEKEILLRAALACSVAIMAKVDNALRMATRMYATGDYLKVYGDNKRCPYREAEAATVEVQLTFQATGKTQTLEAGTELTADGSMMYALDDDVQLTGTAQIIKATAVCQTPGAVGNGLTAGTELQFVQPIDGAVSAVVTEDASGGVDAEDEEAYRERIGREGLAAVTTGPEAMYESLALAASTDVIDAKAKNDGDGIVGIYLIIAAGADQNAVIDAVTQALSPITTRPLNDLVQVHTAGTAAYTLNVKVWYSSYAGIGDAVVAAKDAYQAWQDQRIGRAFDPYRLLSALYQAGCDRVEFLAGSGMGDSPESVTYTEIDDDEHCVGTIQLTVVNT